MTVRTTPIAPLRRAMMVAVGSHPFSNLTAVQGSSRKIYPHPFGLNLSATQAPAGLNEGAGELFLVGDPNDAKNSQQAMLKALRTLIDNEVAPIFYLRRIECGPTRNAEVYFEAGTPSGSFLCGGATTVGTDGFGNYTDLDALFTLMSMVYGVPYDVVTGFEIKDSQKVWRLWSERHMRA